MRRAWDIPPYGNGKRSDRPSFPFRELEDIIAERHSYQDARDSEEAQLDALRADPRILAVVSDPGRHKRFKKSIGRTYDIPVKCGERVVGAIAFGVKEIEGRAAVELVWIEYRPDEGDGFGARNIEHRMTGPDTWGVRPVELPCTCDLSGLPDPERAEREKARQSMRRTRLWLFRAGIKALAGDTRKRPVVQLHRT